MTLDERLSAAISNPAGVRELDLHGSPGDRLAALPATIGKLKELEILRLDHNELTALPASVDKLKNLRELHVAHNRLTNDGIPRGLWFLTKLEVLDLHGNRLTWVDNLGGYQRTQQFALYLGGNPLDPAKYVMGGRPVHPMWHHVLHMLPLTEYGKFRMKTVSLDLGTLTFPLPGPQLHYEPPFEHVERLILYGTPTKEQLAELDAAFPRARVEHHPDPASGPHLVREPALAPPPAAPPLPPSPRPWHPEQLAALAKVKASDPALVRPCVAITTRKPKKGELRVGASRLGGVPDLPPGTEWPVGDSGAPMEFLGQIRLEDVAPYDAQGLLPTSGVLSFFAGDFEDGRVLFFADGVELHPAVFEQDAEFCEMSRGEPYPIAALSFAGDLCAGPDAGDDLRQAIWKHRSKKALHASLSDDNGETYGQFEPDHVLLLLVGSDDRCEMEWGDVGNLFFCIRRDELARRNWDAVELFVTA